MLKNRNKTSVVTGVSGLLGNRIVEHAKNDYTVISIHKTEPLHSNSLKLNITDAKEVQSLFQRKMCVRNEEGGPPKKSKKLIVFFTPTFSALVIKIAYNGLWFDKP